MMEEIRGYDEWKTALPEEPKPVAYCDICGEPLYEGDHLTDICGENWCDGCLNGDLRKIL